MRFLDICLDALLSVLLIVLIVGTPMALALIAPGWIMWILVPLYIAGILTVWYCYTH